MQKIFKIKGVVQNYNWGGKKYIPDLLGVENKDVNPFAEYWLGAHPKCPSFIEGTSKNLTEFIKENGDAILGDGLQKKFQTLPFLFKVLDVEQMLSIQVHPGKESAVKGFEEENKNEIPINAPQRNYKDTNHKPELMIALSDFWLLHGFKKDEDLLNILENVPEFNSFQKIYFNGSYAALFKHVMELPQKEVDVILTPLLERIIPLYTSGRLTKESEDFWAARAALTFCKEDTYDRGIFSIYFLNLVYLKKGEGVFQPQGMLHAYLEGQNIEIMANSDNVLRAGLTDKHVDVQELMKHVVFEATEIKIINPEPGQKREFKPPVEEFALEQISVNQDYSFETKNAEIIFLLDGQVEIDNLILKRGEAAIIKANSTISMQVSTPTQFFRAYTP